MRVDKIVAPPHPLALRRQHQLVYGLATYEIFDFEKSSSKIESGRPFAQQQAKAE